MAKTGPRKVKCQNGNVVEKFYDRATRSCVAIVKDPRGNQVGDAAYSGTVEGRDSHMASMIKDNGGKF